jgi:hypothetical protein
MSSIPKGFKGKFGCTLVVLSLLLKERRFWFRYLQGGFNKNSQGHQSDILEAMSLLEGLCFEI